MLRPSAVAGQFYPDDPLRLRQDVLSYMPERDKQSAIGIVSPHAGYVYSGGIAGETFAHVLVPDTVVVLGPNHYGLGAPLALWQGEGWESPLGPVSINQQVAGRLLDLCPQLAVDSRAHQREHSLEVQVPFIQVANPRAALVPIAIGGTTLEALQSLGAALAHAVRDAETPVLIVASSDMTHFESAESADRKDRLALACVERLDPEGLFRTVREHRISMCGVLPVVAMLFAACHLGASSADLVRYGNSGEQTGNYADVVGYAGLVIH